MEDFSAQNIDKISHNIASLSKDMYEIKKTILSKEKDKEKLSKKDKRRRESLKKAQAKFKNVSTNLSTKDYENFEKRFKELKMSKSAYLKKLIMDDLS
ncbi:MAG: hypothetical protein C0625_00210 [Arcobacter sp.]|nr:MAG: hypothetical protein C0625_00210 [Arcobacter sp.]